MRSSSLAAFACILLSLTSANAEPMTFQAASTGGNCLGCEWVAAEGEITKDTPMAFQRFVAENGNPFHITFNSPGGNLLAGLELGRLIREAGSSTGVSGTITEVNEVLPDWQKQVPGVCASACAYAFMGGTERDVYGKNRLGVHQFYSGDGAEVPSEVVQRLAGAVLFHLRSMGMDSSIMEVASQTSPDDIYWLSEDEMKKWAVTTSEIRQDPWKLEPYSGGLVLTTKRYNGATDSVSVTFFCRQSDRRWRALISEESKTIAKNSPDLRIGGSDHFLEVSIGDYDYYGGDKDIEFQRFSENRFYLSVFLPGDLSRAGGEVFSLSPQLGKLYGYFLDATVDLPEKEWLRAAGRNCLS